MGNTQYSICNSCQTVKSEHQVEFENRDTDSTTYPSTIYLTASLVVENEIESFRNTATNDLPLPSLKQSLSKSQCQRPFSFSNYDQSPLGSDASQVRYYAESAATTKQSVPSKNREEQLNDSYMEYLQRVDPFKCVESPIVKYSVCENLNPEEIESDDSVEEDISPFKTEDESKPAYDRLSIKPFVLHDDACKSSHFFELLKCDDAKIEIISPRFPKIDIQKLDSHNTRNALKIN